MIKYSWTKNEKRECREKWSCSQVDVNGIHLSIFEKKKYFLIRTGLNN